MKFKIGLYLCTGLRYWFQFFVFSRSYPPKSEVTVNCQKLPEIAENGRKLPKTTGKSYIGHLLCTGLRYWPHILYILFRKLPGKVINDHNLPKNAENCTKTAGNCLKILVVHNLVIYCDIVLKFDYNLLEGKKNRNN